MARDVDDDAERLEQVEHAAISRTTEIQRDARARRRRLREDPRDDAAELGLARCAAQLCSPTGCVDTCPVRPAAQRLSQAPQCAAGQACENGVCVMSCVDTKTDPQNCGMCGMVCTPGQICRAENCR